MMYDHPDIQEACIISTADPHRGETVKALVAFKESAKGKYISQEIINWCKERMSAYKYPRIVECVHELPKSGSGKVQWRLLQEEENSKTTTQDGS
jgi:fatty-acyl-CoA synthase